MHAPPRPAQAAGARERLLAEGGQLTEAERARILELLEQLADSSSLDESLSWSLLGANGNGSPVAA